MRKSIFMGLLAIVCNNALAEDKKLTHQVQLSTENGRYVFGQISDFRQDQFMLDTETGRLWQMVVDKESSKKLQPVPFIQILGNEAYIPDAPKEVDFQKDYSRNKALSEFGKPMGDANDKK
jgi:hypothetical protein